MRKSIQLLYVLFLVTMLAGCSSGSLSQPSRTLAATEISTSIPTRETTVPRSTDIVAEYPDPTPIKTILVRDDQKTAEKTPYFAGYPNFWTNIDKQKIELFPIDWISDYTYAKDGSLWFAGGYGVIHQFKDGKQDWFSMKNGLQVNDITSIAISPDQEVWVGGVDNSLYRYDGKVWIDEGINFPVLVDPRHEYVCSSTDIAGIDFDEKGNIWVLTGGMEIFTKVYGQWAYFPFPKNLLPMAGGGACPIGIRVVSEKDITIKRAGCCGSGPTGYHFDGIQWKEDVDFSSVDALLNARHQEGNDLLDNFSKKEKDTIQLPFSKNNLLPFFGGLSLAGDHSGNIWLLTDFDSRLFKYEKESFRTIIDQNVIPGSFEESEPDITKSQVLKLDNDIYYFQEGKRPGILFRYIYDSEAGKNIPNSMVFYNPAIDSKGRVWIYYPDAGIFTVDMGKIEKFSSFSNFNDLNHGEPLPVDGGKVILGGPGAIWFIEKDRWEEMEIPGESQIMTFIAEDSRETLYAATDTGVYKITGNSFTSFDFVKQNENPIVIPPDGKSFDCVYTRRYSIPGNCPGMSDSGSIPGVHYKALLLKVQPDGSVIYINNKIVAKLVDGSWKSFLFDSIEIKSAEVDKDGNIWLNSNLNGLIKLSPDIFDDYIESEW